MKTSDLRVRMPDLAQVTPTYAVGCQELYEVSDIPVVVLVPLVDDDRGGVTLPCDRVGKTTHDVPVEQRDIVCPVGGDEIADFDLVSHGSNLSSFQKTLHRNENGPEGPCSNSHKIPNADLLSDVL